MSNQEIPLLVNSSDAEKATLVLAHGAGAPMDSPFMERLSSALVNNGVSTIRFEFPYMLHRRETGKKRPPDKLEILEHFWHRVISAVESVAKSPLYIGGKSMGGRIATMLDVPASINGICCFGYPFHPPGKPENLRIAHLNDISVPLLVFQGERDKLGNYEEVKSYGLNSVDIQWIETADHDLKPLVRSGIEYADVFSRVAARVRAFVAG